MPQENALELRGVTHRFDGFTLDNVSFDVPKGSIMGFVGQNGAGKTTTIRSILNILHNDSGTIRVYGLDSVKDEMKIKEDIAVVFDELPFSDVLTPTSLERVLKGLYKKWDSTRYYELVDRFSMPRKKKIHDFSRGMKMKLQICTALSHGAKLLIMDEATSGLDPVVRSEMLDIFLEFIGDEEHTVLMSSHITSDIEKIADSVTFIDGGRILLSGYTSDILADHAVLKCAKEDIGGIATEDIVSVRLSDFGADVMLRNFAVSCGKYDGFTVNKTTLDEILLFYVKRNSGKEWR